MTATATRKSLVGKRPGKNVRRPAAGETATGKLIRRGGRPSTFGKLASKAWVSALRNCGEAISVVDAAEIFGVTTQTARQWIRAGYLPPAFFAKDSGDRKLYMSVNMVIDRINGVLNATAVG